MPRVRGIWWLYVAAVAAALVLRLLWLDDRPLHHDEGVNAWFVGNLMDGYRWSYDPGRFHGPFLFFFHLPIAALFGVSTLAFRLPVALVSTATLLLLLPLRRWLSPAGTVAAAWLLAVSPSLVAYGRDFIHETYLVFFTLALVVSVARLIETPTEGTLALSAACLAGLATVKETYVLTLAALAIAALAAFGVERIWRTAKALKPVARKGRDWAVFAFGVPYLLLFTSFFTNLMGLPDSVRTFLLWFGKGVAGEGHAKPWHYFLRLLVEFEPVVLAFALAAVVVALIKKDAFAVFAGVWTGVLVVAYSAIPYKTPWLALNLVLPAALTAGCLVRHAAVWPRWVRGALVSLLIAGLGWGVWRTVEVAFMRHDDDSLRLVYTPTHRDAWKLMDHVRQAASRAPDPEKATVRIYGGHSWPLPWYFRDLSGMVYKVTVEPEEGVDSDVVIVEDDMEGELKPLLEDRYDRKTFLLRPRETLVVLVRWPGSAGVPPAG